jgi:hypothetical protein
MSVSWVMSVVAITYNGVLLIEVIKLLNHYAEGLTTIAPLDYVSNFDVHFITLKVRGRDGYY